MASNEAILWLCLDTFGTPVSWDSSLKIFMVDASKYGPVLSNVSTLSLVSDQSKIHSPVDKLLFMKEMKYCKTDIQICYNTFLT